MTSSPHIPESRPESRLTRRTFVGAVTTAGAVLATGVATAGTASAAPATLDRAVGVARLGATVHTLGLASDGWLLVAANGSSRPTTGLAGADVLDLAAGPAGGVVAVGALADGDRSSPTVWESADGLDWHVATSLTGLDGHLTAVAVRGGDALALGALLTVERAPRQRFALRYQDNSWQVAPVDGLAYTDELAVSAAAGGPDGWLLSTVDSSGSVLATSADGLTWTAGAGLVDTAIRSLAVTGAGVRWVGNVIGGSGGQSGVVGAGRQPVAVPQEAKALGVLGDQSYWLVDGRIVSATV
ncbi:hypothetical protein [Actinophytocola sediminis]